MLREVRLTLRREEDPLPTLGAMGPWELKNGADKGRMWRLIQEPVVLLLGFVMLMRTQSDLFQGGRHKGSTRGVGHSSHTLPSSLTWHLGCLTYPI